jgi:hypothetical protein
VVKLGLTKNSAQKFFLRGVTKNSLKNSLTNFEAVRLTNFEADRLTNFEADQGTRREREQGCHSQSHPSPMAREFFRAAREFFRLSGSFFLSGTFLKRCPMHPQGL